MYMYVIPIVHTMQFHAMPCNRGGRLVARHLRRGDEDGAQVHGGRGREGLHGGQLARERPRGQERAAVPKRGQVRLRYTCMR